MESCLGGKPERVGPVLVDDIKRDLLDEFSALSKQEKVRNQSENLQVYLRVRPFAGAESSGSQECCLAIEGPQTVVLKAPGNRPSDKGLPQTEQRFTFTQVFGPDAGQRRVFEGSVRALVRDVLHGKNALVFTYGVTNAGKTFTLLGPEHDGGLLPRCLRLIFDSAEGRLYAAGDLKPSRCRDFCRLSEEQRAAEGALKTGLLRTLHENDKSGTSAGGASLEASSLGSECGGGGGGGAESDRFHLDVPAGVRFSVWVSFCEIYNDNIHDLLEQVPGGKAKRTVLRLSQDVKGNTFIKDLKWIQVSGSEEALKVVKIGRKNQSLASTRLNRQSSRSHSIFSVRVLRAEVSAGVGAARFLGVGELALCDLAGSERCSRTRNTGERLKEAGSINSSLLALGKCMGAMRLKQNAGRREHRFRHHVPFRESKLTHFLQLFLSGAGKVTMVVNVNRDASCADETLNVLKFSALAQKVAVSDPRPASPDRAAVRSAAEVSVLIDRADLHGNGSSSVALETTLEDLAEEEGGDEAGAAPLLAGDNDDDRQQGEAARLLLEAQIREEVCAQFTQIFHKMEKDYRERLEREREILEERADKRLEILKKLLGARDWRGPPPTLEALIGSLGEDLKEIGEDALEARRQLLLADREDEGKIGRLDAELRRLREANLEKDHAISRLGEELRRLKEEERRATEDEPAIARRMLELQTQVRTLERKLRREEERAAAAEARLRRPDADVAPPSPGGEASRARDEREESATRKSPIIWGTAREGKASDGRLRETSEEPGEFRPRDETERGGSAEPAGAPPDTGTRAPTLVEELKEVMEKLGERRRREALAPVTSPTSPATARSESAGGKRKSSQVEGLSWSGNLPKKRKDVADAARAPPPDSRATRPKRGQRKLYGKERVAAPLVISPDPTCAAGDAERQQSHHEIIKRQLRFKSARK
ncbi:kinesin-like protein KIF20B isoform X2 [Stigmatopora argus]